MFTRRNFLQALALSPLCLTPISRLAFADPSKTGGRKPFMLIVFLRGGADGLSILNPVGDKLYYQHRPTTAFKNLKDPNLWASDYFQLNPAMSHIVKHWHNKNLAFITEFGSPSNTRSHFDAQDFFGSGVVDRHDIRDGFLNRFAKHYLHDETMPIVSIQHQSARFTQGSFPIISVPNLDEVNKLNIDAYPKEYYMQQEKNFLGNNNQFAKGDRLYEALKILQHNSKTPVKPASFPTRITGQFNDIARLVKGDIGLSIAVTEMRGWDTHILQGAEGKGQYTQLLNHLTDCLNQFIEEIGEKFADTTIVIASEFGRTVKENGALGTDHGHGSTAFVLGGNINGGRVFGEWSGLHPDDLYEGRDLHVTTDYRSLFSGILKKNYQVSDLKDTFPDFVDTNQNLINKIIKA